jgi:hypothetical protein
MGEWEVGTVGLRDGGLEWNGSGKGTGKVEGGRRSGKGKGQAVDGRGSDGGMGDRDWDRMCEGGFEQGKKEQDQ